MLTEEIKTIIQNNTIGCVATVSPEGLPCVSPKGMFLVFDETTLVFAHARSPGTLRNLEHNPNIEVCFTDIFQRTACRVRGVAEIVTHESDRCKDYSAAFEQIWPTLKHLINSYAVIHVTQAKQLTSPVYDIGMKAPDLARHWVDHYSKMYAIDEAR
jgi:general stress protein 26